jgi:hypothetical protein
VIASYGVTDRHGTDGARRGLAENERFIRQGGRGMVGVHAAFTCGDDTLEAAAGLARDLGVGVHIHVAEGVDDIDAGARLRRWAQPDWLLVHAVHLDRELPGVIVHNPRSNLNNAVGYAHPSRRSNTVMLGTDGIGADMPEDMRLAYVVHRSHDVTASPETAWGWMTASEQLVPDVRDDRVTWTSGHADDPWHVAFTPGLRALHVLRADGEALLIDGRPTRVDMVEVRARAAEQAHRLHALL